MGARLLYGWRGLIYRVLGIDEDEEGSRDVPAASGGRVAVPACYVVAGVWLGDGRGLDKLYSPRACRVRALVRKCSEPGRALDTFSFLVRETKNMPPQPTEIAALLMQDVIELSEARMAYVARIKQAVDNLQLALGM